MSKSEHLILLCTYAHICGCIYSDNVSIINGNDDVANILSNFLKTMRLRLYIRNVSLFFLF